jgi:acyl carrier protein
MEEIISRVSTCVGAVLKLDQDDIKGILADDPLHQVGMDSLNCVEVVVNIEKEFNVEFNDDELLIDNLNTIHKLSRIVAGKIGVVV